MYGWDPPDGNRCASAGVQPVRFPIRGNCQSHASCKFQIRVVVRTCAGCYPRVLLCSTGLHKNSLVHKKKRNCDGVDGIGYGPLRSIRVAPVNILYTRGCVYSMHVKSASCVGGK